MSLTPEQDKIRKEAVAWYRANKGKNNIKPFVIQGQAGTGKSFTVKYIIESLDELDPWRDVSYIAFTGQAAVNLIRKGNNGTTIHRLIYDVFEDKRTHKLSFKKKEELDRDYKLIILDEVGMVSQSLLDDLLSFNIPVIALGDNQQLESFSKDVNHLLDKPDGVLNTPMRQALDSPILRLAYKILDGGNITYQDADPANGLYIIPKGSIPDHYLVEADQIITGTNKVVDMLTDRVRHDIFNLESPYPYENEKLMCVRNNWTTSINIDSYDQFLTNGLTGFASKFGKYNKRLNTFTMNFTPSYSANIKDNDALDSPTFKEVTTDAIYFDKGIKSDDYFYAPENASKYKKLMYNRAGWEAANFTRINKFTFGYAETVYKSQGSEWDSVLYYDNFWKSRDMFRRQRYVALTRAKKYLAIAI